MKNVLLMWYRKLIQYLSDSSALSTGSHRGNPHGCGMYSGLSDLEKRHGEQ